MRFRFSLRFLMILFTLIAVCFGGGAHYVYRIKDQVRRHKAAVAKLKEMNCEIEVSIEEPTKFVALVRKWVDVDYGQQASDFRCDRRLSPREASEILGWLDHVQGIDTIDIQLQCLNQQAIDHLKAHSGLRRLYLSFLDENDRASSHLEELTSLTSFSLDDPLSDEAAVALAHLPELSGLTADLSRLSSKGCAALSRLKKLEGAALQGHLQSSEPLDALFRIPNLTSIILHSGSINDQAATAFENATSIKSMTIVENFQLPPEFFARLSRSPALERISFWWGENTKHLDVASLANCKTLRSIYFASRILTGDELLSLRALPVIESLEFRGAIDDAVIFAFLKESPRCKIDMRTVKEDFRGPDGWQYSLTEEGGLNCEEYTVPKCGVALASLALEEAEQAATDPAEAAPPETTALPPTAP